jgi:hypothetical protein
MQTAKFREFLEEIRESANGDFQKKIRTAKTGEACEDIMKELEAAFKDHKINQNEFDMLTAMCGRKMDKLEETVEETVEAVEEHEPEETSELDEKKEGISPEAKEFMIEFNRKVNFLKYDIEFSTKNSDWKTRIEDIGLLIKKTLAK